MFSKADELRADPAYKTVQVTSRLLVNEAVDDDVRQLVEKIVSEDVESGRVSPEEVEGAIKAYTELCNRSHRSNHVDTVGTIVLQNKLPEDSPLYQFLQPGSSDIGRLCILEALGFNEKNIRGCITFGSKRSYEWRVQESEEFFNSAEEEQERQLNKLLSGAKNTIARERAERKRREEVAYYEKKFGDSIQRAVEWFKANAESLRQDGYIMAHLSKFPQSKEEVQLIKGSLSELRQIFPDLCYPSGLNILDYLSEQHSADSTKAAVLVGAHVTGTGEVYKLGLDLATIYIKSPVDSSEG